jgi:hypothetical protein
VSEATNEQTERYEPPILTEVGQFADVTRGQYSRTHSDDGDAGGYWDK